MQDVKDFPFPLDTPIEQVEEVEVLNPVVDQNTKKVDFVKSKEKIKSTVIYSVFTKHKLSCRDKTHFWYVKDPHKYVASCKNCMKNLFLTPLKTTIKDGKIIDRATKEVIA
jgi:hypothetical protein